MIVFFPENQEKNYSFDYVVGYFDEPPSCPLCSSWVDMPDSVTNEEKPWLGVCRKRGHKGMFALDSEE